MRGTITSAAPDLPGSHPCGLQSSSPFALAAGIETDWVAWAQPCSQVAVRAAGDQLHPAQRTALSTLRRIGNCCRKRRCLQNTSCLPTLHVSGPNPKLGKQQLRQTYE